MMDQLSFDLEGSIDLEWAVRSNLPSSFWSAHIIETEDIGAVTAPAMRCCNRPLRFDGTRLGRRFGANPRPGPARSRIGRSGPAKGRAERGSAARWRAAAFARGRGDGAHGRPGRPQACLYGNRRDAVAVRPERS